MQPRSGEFSVPKGWVRWETGVWSVSTRYERLLDRCGAPGLSEIVSGEATVSASPERARRLIAVLTDGGFSPEALLQPRRRDVKTLAEGHEAASRYVDAVVDSYHRGGRPAHHHWPFVNLLFRHADRSAFLLDTDMDAELLFVWAWGSSAPSATSTLLEAMAVELGEE